MKSPTMKGNISLTSNHRKLIANSTLLRCLFDGGDCCLDSYGKDTKYCDVCTCKDSKKYHSLQKVNMLQMRY